MLGSQFHHMPITFPSLSLLYSPAIALCHSEYHGFCSAHLLYCLCGVGHRLRHLSSRAHPLPPRAVLHRPSRRTPLQDGAPQGTVVSLSCLLCFIRCCYLIFVFTFYTLFESSGVYFLIWTSFGIYSPVNC